MENNGNFFKKLWSSKSNSHQQPTLSSDKSPTFNSHNFTNSTVQSNSSEHEVASPSSFYSGKVQYGGAMSASRNSLLLPQTLSKPSQEDNDASISDNKPKREASSKKTSEMLSSTARKIFQALERMSTPLRDVKKIPPPSIKISSSLGKMQRKRSSGTILLETSKKRCPPSRGIMLHSHTSISSSSSIPLKNSLSNQYNVKKISPELEKSFMVYKGKPAVVAALSSSVGIKVNKTTGSTESGGKMRVPRKTSHYSSTKTTEKSDSINEYTLPDVPITVNSLPNFDFGKPSSASTPAIPQSTQLSFPKIDFDKPGSTSTPALPKSNKSKMTELLRKSNIFAEPVYTFSPPTATPSQSKYSLLKTVSVRFQENAFPSTNKLQAISKRSADQYPEEPAHKQSTAISSKVSAPSALKTTGSVMDILGQNIENKGSKQLSHVSVEQPSVNQVLSEASKHSLAGKAKVSDNTVQNDIVNDSSSQKWQCDTCLIFNNADDEKCAACETPKPSSKASALTIVASSEAFSSNIGTFGNKIGGASRQPITFGSDSKEVQESGSRNKLTDPNSDRNLKKRSVSTSTSNFKFGITRLQQTSDSKWECQVCLVPNSADRTRCIACDSPRHDLKKSGSDVSHEGSSFKFGNTSSTVLQFGVPKTTSPASKGVSSTTPTKSLSSVAASYNSLGGFGSKTSITANKTTSSAINLPVSTTASIVSTLKFGSKYATSSASITGAGSGTKPTFSFGSNSQSQSPAQGPKASTALFSFGSGSNSSTVGGFVSNTSSFQTGHSAVKSDDINISTAPVKRSTEGSAKCLPLFHTSPSCQSSQPQAVHSAATSAAVQSTLLNKLIAIPSSSVSQTTQTTVGFQAPVSQTTSNFSFGSNSSPGYTQSTPALFGSNLISASNTSGLQNSKPLSVQTQSASSIFGSNLSSGAGGQGFQNSTALSSQTQSASLAFSATTSSNLSSQGIQNTNTFSGQSQSVSTMFGSTRTSASNGLQSTKVSSAQTQSAAPMFGSNLTSALNNQGLKSEIDKPLSTQSQSTMFGSSFVNNSNNPGFQPGQTQSAPLLFGSSASSSNSQAFNKPVGAGNEQKSTSFSGFEGVTRSQTPPVKSSFTGFGTPQTTSLSGGTLPKPSFNFGNASSQNASSQQQGNINVFGNNVTPNKPSQAAGFPFGVNSNISSTVPMQNPSVFQAAESASKPSFSFGSASASSTNMGFQFGSSQNNQPSGNSGTGFSFGSNSHNPAPSAGFNFGAAQNIPKPFTSMPSQGFKFGSAGQQQSQPQVNSTFGFGSASTQAFPQNTPPNNPPQSMFSIGQGNTSGRSSTPLRQTKLARRRLQKKN